MAIHLGNSSNRIATCTKATRCFYQSSKAFLWPLAQKGKSTLPKQYTYIHVILNSWTPPVFLEPAPDYRFRLWSQPSEAGIIDEYSAEFSMVPRPDDAYMFSYKKSIVMDISNSTLPPDTRIRIGQYSLPPVNETEHSDIMLDVSESPTASFSDPNIPTGIYALYPSDSWQVSFGSHLFVLVTVTVFIVAFG